MKTILTLFVAGMLTAGVLSSSPATAAPAQIMTDVGGTVHIQQNVPCGDPVEVTPSIIEGRLEITPRMTHDRMFFDLTRLDMLVSPFSVERACRGISAVADFSEIGVRLAGAVRFQGQAVPTTDGSHLYRFVIPKKSLLIFESVLDNQRRRRPETAYQRPSRRVTGVIELVASDRGMVVKRAQLRVFLQTQLHFQAGCVPGGACAIDEVDYGTQTTHVVAGVLGADTAPPSEASATAP